MHPLAANGPRYVVAPLELIILDQIPPALELRHYPSAAAVHVQYPVLITMGDVDQGLACKRV